MTREETLEFLKAEETTRRKRTRVIVAISLVLLAIQAAYLGYIIATKRGETLDVVLMTMPMIFLVTAAAGMSPQAKSALDSVLESNDLALIGHLFEASAFYGAGTIPPRVRQCLLQVLPKADDTSLALDEVQHTAMLQALSIYQTQKDEAFLVTLVRALPFIGRKETLPHLERLAADGAKVSPAVRNAAIAALPELRMRIAKGIIERASEAADARRSEIEQRLVNSAVAPETAIETHRQA